jgi:N-acetylglucosaminyl-diphospho-decaprenol L-rhamnosyltransferase
VSDEVVAVVVVSYNSAAVLPGLIASLDAGLGDLAWHLTLADNASSDGSVSAVLEARPSATIVNMGRNAGYAAGLNAAVAAAGPCTAVLALNPDVRLTPECVPTLAKALRSPGVGIAVPRLVDGDGVLIDSMRRTPTVLRALGDAMLGADRAGRFPVLGEVVTNWRHYAIERDTDWAEGSTQLISAECWQRCAPWDESFFLYSEETDFALRARDAGFVTRYVPSAQAIHLEGDSGVSPPLWALLTVNRVRLFRRRHGLTSTAAFWLAMLMREVSRALIGKQTSRSALRALVNPRRFREQPGPDTIAA